jgi:hypothetical protein
MPKGPISQRCHKTRSMEAARRTTTNAGQDADLRQLGGRRHRSPAATPESTLVIGRFRIRIPVPAPSFASSAACASQAPFLALRLPHRSHHGGSEPRRHADRLLDLAAAVDPGLDELVFADMLDTLARLTDEEIPAPVAQVPTIRAFADAWAVQLRDPQAKPLTHPRSRRPGTVAGMTSGMTKGVLAGRPVLWEPWGVLSVLVVPWGRRPRNA